MLIKALLLVVLLCLVGVEAREYPYGRVDFNSSCLVPVKNTLSDGIAALHSFWFTRASSTFDKVIELDPDCAMAYWGKAMSLWKPLWGLPSEEQLDQGTELIQVGMAKFHDRPGSEREFAYLSAGARLFQHGRTNITLTDRLHSFNIGMLHIYITHYQGEDGEDIDAAAFYCLWKLAPSLISGETDTIDQLEAGAILESVRITNPVHPGVLHYLIHARDTHALAPQGLLAADHYAEAAPAVPHALHMPSHIYNRLGMWKDSSWMNRRAMEAEIAVNPAASPSHITEEYAHALNYLGYAEMQLGNYVLLRNLVPADFSISEELRFSVANDMMQFLARLEVEAENWEAASTFTFKPAGYTKAFAWGIIQEQYVQALGLYHLKDFEGLKTHASEFAKLVNAWNGSVENEQFPQRRFQIQLFSQVVSGLNTVATSPVAAIAKLEAATEFEATAPFNTPILPTGYLLAKLYTKQGDIESAIDAYQRTLDSYPRHLRSLFGLANAFEGEKRSYEAQTAWRELVEVSLQTTADTTDPDFFELAKVKVLDGDLCAKPSTHLFTLDTSSWVSLVLGGSVVLGSFLLGAGIFLLIGCCCRKKQDTEYSELTLDYGIN